MILCFPSSDTKSSAAFAIVIFGTMNLRPKYLQNAADVFFRLRVESSLSP